MKLTEKKFYPWLVVGLLWIVALLNYLDRQMLSTMQQNIGADITLVADPKYFGYLMAIFLWVYGVFSPFSGAVADRVSRKWLIVGSLGVWSGVTYAMGYCDDFEELMWLRGIMGISEALYIPSALSLIADFFTGKGRSLAIGLHMTGLYCGQALGGFGSMVATTWSWQSTFHWFGIIGVGYALVLTFLLYEKSGHGSAAPASRKTDTKVKKENVIQSLATVFSTMAFWVILFFFASSSIPGWATKNWLPTLFHDNLSLTMEWAGPMATLTIAVSSFIGVMIGGPLSDRWVKRNVKGRIYTSAIGLAMMIPALVLIGVAHNAVFRRGLWNVRCQQHAYPLPVRVIAPARHGLRIHELRGCDHGRHHHPAAGWTGRKGGTGNVFRLHGRDTGSGACAAACRAPSEIR